MTNEVSDLLTIPTAPNESVGPFLRDRDVFILPGKPAEQANVPVEGEETGASSVI